MNRKATFVIPNFDKSVKGKISDAIQVPTPNSLHLDTNGIFWYLPAIATNGFSSTTDGVYVFAMKINEAKNGDFMVGFTDTKTFDSKSSGFAGNSDFKGTSLGCIDGSFDPDGAVPYLSPNITKKAKEIISIFAISNNGKKEIQVIVDGNEGPVLDCTQEFGNGGETFVCVSLGSNDQQIEFIPLDQVKSRSPKIDELMKEFNSQHKQQQPISSAPSTSTAENDAVISHLREQVARSQDAAVKDRDEMIRDLKQQLTVKDQQISARDQQHREELRAIVESKDNQLERIVQSHRTDLGLSHQQLELERAEHQKTRNLLHQIKMELKDMEIFYLNREKESGQRRQREEDNEEFKVKQEPNVEQEKQEPAPKKTANKKK